MAVNEIIINNVIQGSIAQELGIERGDVLLKINGSEVHDTIEYRYLTCDENINMLIRKGNGEEWELEIEKDYYDDLGIEFDDPLLNNSQRCNNKCIFCFIDQLPKGMRGSLYFKDDDSRLSFLQGNFVTLTNMSDEDIQRIIKYRISPINVSVHTTNPELRVKMLNNRKAGFILDRLKELTDGGISINCQIVLCPDINDGTELDRTLRDLFTFYPQISNVAIVPVGVTRFRERLYEINGYDMESSRAVIKLVRRIQEEFENSVGEPFARLADEFYIMAGEDIPSTDYYGDFEQLEDGIGMTRYIQNIIEEDICEVNFDGKGARVAFLTGELSSKYIRNISKIIEEKLNIVINVYTIKNNFFGGKVTVTGLITGKDIIEQVGGRLKENTVFIPVNMLRAGEDIFLDDVSVSELGEKLGARIVKCKYTGEDLIENLINEVVQWQNR